MAHVRRSSIAAGVTVAGLAAAAVAVAATPTAGQWTTSGGESSGSFVVKGGSIVAAPRGTSKAIIAPSDAKCSFSAEVKARKIKISNGRFAYDGPAYVNKGSDKTKVGRLRWSGTFTSATTVKGKVRFTSNVTPKYGPAGITFEKKKCDSGTKSWTGQPLQQPAGSGPVSLG